MATHLREKVHETVNQLSDRQLTDTLRFMELLMTAPAGTDVEPEEMWLLATGALKRLVDETENAPAPVEDWRRYLHDL